jgi:hypothetical protein
VRKGELLAARLAVNGARVTAARRLEAHCMYHPSTTAWAFAAGRALIDGGAVPECPPG